MSLTHSHERDDQLLIRYLVGSLSEDETERLDELSIADDRFAADLHAVEHDLVDAYVRLTLVGDIRQRFEMQYLSSPAGRAKVAFATALLRYRKSGAPAPEKGEPAPEKYVASAFRRTPRLAGAPWPGAARPLLQWSLAAAAMVLLAIAGYLLSENARLKRQLFDVRAGLEGRQQQLEQQLRQEQSANADRARELDRVRQSLAQLQGATPLVASFVLLPPTRGATELPTLSIPRGITTVALQVTLESEDFPAYRVTLKDPATGQIIWRSATLQASGTASKAVSITLGADMLKPRTYTLEVSGMPARGAAESVGIYPFRVVLQ
jgi:hypothetical protein